LRKQIVAEVLLRVEVVLAGVEVAEGVLADRDQQLVAREGMGVGQLGEDILGRGEVVDRADQPERVLHVGAIARSAVAHRDPAVLNRALTVVFVVEQVPVEGRRGLPLVDRAAAVRSTHGCRVLTSIDHDRPVDLAVLFLKSR